MESFSFRNEHIGRTFRVKLFFIGDDPFVEYVPFWGSYTNTNGDVTHKPIKRFISYTTIDNNGYVMPYYLKYTRSIYLKVLEEMLVNESEIAGSVGVGFDITVYDEQLYGRTFLRYEFSEFKFLKREGHEEIITFMENEEPLESVAERLTVSKPTTIKKPVYNGEGMRHKFV